MAQKINVRQGKRGRWRWQLKRDGKHICMSGIRGFETEAEAARAAMDAFSGSVEIETSEFWGFAGERDFSD